jgi:hypothetical protein
MFPRAFFVAFHWYPLVQQFYCVSFTPWEYSWNIMKSAFWALKSLALKCQLRLNLRIWNISAAKVQPIQDIYTTGISILPFTTRPVSIAFWCFDLDSFLRLVVGSSASCVLTLHQKHDLFTVPAVVDAVSSLLSFWQEKSNITATGW